MFIWAIMLCILYLYTSRCYGLRLSVLNKLRNYLLTYLLRSVSDSCSIQRLFESTPTTLRWPCTGQLRTQDQKIEDLALIKTTFIPLLFLTMTTDLTSRQDCRSRLILTSVVAYGPKMVKPLHAGPKHQIWYMYSLGQYKHFWMGYPILKVKVKVRSRWKVKPS